jgi:hypothetical protein
MVLLRKSPLAESLAYRLQMKSPISRTFNPMLDHWRRDVEKHNTWEHDNLRMSKRSKAQSRPSQITHARGAMCMAVLLAGDYVAKAQTALPTSGNAAFRRTHQPQSHTPSSIAELGGNVQGAPDWRGRSPGEQQVMETRSTGAPKTGVGLHLAAFKSSGPRVDGHLVEHRGFKFANITSGIAPMRRIRSADAPPRPSAYRSLNGDLSIDAGGVIGARVLAMRGLLRKAAINREDEQLLELANGIHRAAQQNPASTTAVDLSLALLREEAGVWAQAQGAGEVEVGEHAKTAAFLEAWSLTLNPPPPPDFKNRTELAKIYIEKEELSPEIYYPKVHETIELPNQAFVNLISDSREIAIQFFKQFDNYIRLHVDTAVKAKMMSNLEDAGVGRLNLEFRPEKTWVINEVSVMMLDPVSRTYRTIQQYVPDRREPALLVLASKGRHLLIRPDGSLKYVNDAVKNGKVNKSVIVKALGGGPSINAGGGNATRDDIAGGEIWSFPPQLKFDSDLLETPHRPVKIGDIVEAKVRRHLLSLIETWKESEYEPALGERVLNFVVPFYETVNRSLLDPRYKITVADIAMDVVDLGLTLFSIGSSALCAKGVRAGIRAARAAKSISASARASAIVRAVLEGSKTSSFLIQAGKELTDFVVPVFTVSKILHSATRMSWRGAARLVRREVVKMDRAAGEILDKADLLGEIYESVARGSGYAISAKLLKEGIDERAAASIPQKLYRGQNVAPSGNILYSPWKQVDASSEDDYLAACIRHSARTGGSAGEVLSLSAHAGVAIRFMRGPEARLIEIDAAQDLLNFRTIENIIKMDGPRLVREGKIKAGTLAAAIRNSGDQGEYEFFYTRGSIPDSMVKVHATDALPENAVVFDDHYAYHPDVAHSKKVAASGIPPHRLESVASRLGEMGQWNSEIGDLAPLATANALGRQIVVHGHPANANGLTLVPRGLKPGPPVHVVYQPGHYEALIDGKQYEVIGDGDCFFRAVLMGLNRATDVSPQAIRQLRENAAKEVLRHSREYEPFLSSK